jgi:hypothetical protein
MDTNELTIGEAATQALKEIAARAARIERLQLEFDEVEIDGGVIATPATPEGLNKLIEQILKACEELQAVPQGWRNSKEFKLAVDCLEKMLVEYRYQSDDLAARKD